MTIPQDYAERVYAGVLGKIIGVYLGRPFEGWTYERITAELGEIWYYVNERLGVPLIVTDDDISGTFTFLRALPDYGNQRTITPAQIGQTWLNYLIERRTVLWWGGLGNSTEHTAYMRLKQGYKAPESGSIALNGKVVAEQIGAQIFIDGWAMVAPGDPAFAADLARRAGSVSHDGEAIYGAQVLAAMEAQAFVEPDINTLIDTGLSVIPKNSVIYRMINEIREWHAAQPDDWRATRAQIAAHYGYDKYGGNCHMVPNHALIIHALLHGDDDFQKSLMIVNTCGWDTDCNSGNVGCLLGIKNGLAGIEAGADFRGPVADRMYLATADGGRAITDAATEAFHIVNVGRALADQAPVAPKDGARFHFELPGSVQGFQVDSDVDAAGTLEIGGRFGRWLQLHRSEVWNVGLIGLAAGLIAARLWNVFQFWHIYRVEPTLIISLRPSGFALWPGIVAAVIAGCVYIWRKRLGPATVENVTGHSRTGHRSLAIHYPASRPVASHAWERLHLSLRWRSPSTSSSAAMRSTLRPRSILGKPCRPTYPPMPTMRAASRSISL